ncbi:hypothetical protein SAMN05216553_105314 [Lentzea fradiae]|uniref:Uncharacterized protein n=1 Tax=Lentzea fradiae TaxID=200378 RepID=A0A1G7RHS2_9PSEU|nr:hypothetical protein [Lentzea fradiae]SDG09689.1 hypothetical protein SAMN05216553_105314 [Lentzea fradiae]
MGRYGQYFGEGQGRRLCRDGDTEVWGEGHVRRAGGDAAQPGRGPTPVTAAEIGVPAAASYRVLGLWNGELPATPGPLGGEVAGHGVLALRVWPVG